MSSLQTLKNTRLGKKIASIPKRIWKEIAIHFLLWVIFMLYEGVLIYKIAKLEVVSFAYLIPSYTIFAIFVYVHALVLLPRFLENRRFIAYIILLAGLIVGLIYIKYIIRYDILPALNIKNMSVYGNIGFRFFLALQITYMGQYIIYSTGYWYALRVIKLQKRKSELKRQLLKAQSDYLRFQINPHFLYNTLNFFYGQIQPLSQPLADGIHQLSDMMRYAVSEEESDQKVDLEREIRHIENFIAMQQLRFNNKCNIDYQLKGNIYAKRILPLILITFVENLFKHGELFDANTPAIIHIDIVENTFSLHIQNKKSMGIKDPSSGIGLANILNRLSLFYQDRYKYDVNQDDFFYNCNLIIHL